MKTLSTIAIALFLSPASEAVVGPLINGNQINPQTAISISTLSVTGGGGMAVANSITASSVTTTGSGFKGAGTNLTGTAASLTAGNVTTNANLTGPVTSVGNATTIAGPVPTAAVDLSTVTTALALKANLNGATFTGASGITNAAFTATGANGNIVSASSITTTGGLFGASLRVTGQASGTQCASFDGSGNLTGTGSACATSSGFASLTANQTFSGTNTFTSEVALASGAMHGGATGILLPGIGFSSSVYVTASSTWLVPSGVYSFELECWSGGGGGTGSTGSHGCAGGGSGSYADGVVVSTPGASYYFNISTGGLGGASGGNDGLNALTQYAGNTSLTQLLTLPGGGRGIDGNGASGTPGAAGAAATASGSGFQFTMLRAGRAGDGGASDNGYPCHGASAFRGGEGGRPNRVSSPSVGETPGGGGAANGAAGSNFAGSNGGAGACWVRY